MREVPTETTIAEPPRHYLRLNRFVGLDPEGLAGSLERFGADQLPTLEATPGFRTLFFGVDYERGRAAAATFWRSDSHLRLSERTEGPMRELALRRAGGDLGRGLVDSYQIIFEERPEDLAPRAPTAARLSRWEGIRPSDISDAAARWERDRLPELRAMPGYRGVFVGANMLLGNTLSVSLWDSAEALQGSLAWERASRTGLERMGMVPRSVLADSYTVALAPELRCLPPWPAWDADAIAA